MPAVYRPSRRSRLSTTTPFDLMTIPKAATIFIEEILMKPWMIWDIERKRAECERENEVAHRLHLPLPLPQDKQWKRPTPARRDEIVT